MIWIELQNTFQVYPFRLKKCIFNMLDLILSCLVQTLNLVWNSKILIIYVREIEIILTFFAQAENNFLCLNEFNFQLSPRVQGASSSGRETRASIFYCSVCITATRSCPIHCFDTFIQQFLKNQNFSMYFEGLTAHLKWVFFFQTYPFIHLSCCCFFVQQTCSYCLFSVLYFIITEKCAT